MLDGPLHGIRHRRGLPVIGYVKTHHRRMLAREQWVRVPELTAGERSGLFAMKDALCYLRVGNPGPWAGPWAGIARLEMPSGIGRDATVEAAERAAGWLPVFASALHWDARAPVNLTPIAGLERHLHRLQGDARLALRAVREAVLERNRERRTSAGRRSGSIMGGAPLGAAMNASVYIETSVVSYLTARPSRDVVVAAYQQVTREWWRSAPDRFVVFASALVISEAGTGDEDAARARLDLLATIPLLDATPEAVELTRTLLDLGAVPRKAADDAAHIAIAATNGVDYLVTWNFRHIANATMRSRIEDVCQQSGHKPPVICTPNELMESDHAEDTEGPDHR